MCRDSSLVTRAAGRDVGGVHMGDVSGGIQDVHHFENHGHIEHYNYVDKSVHNHGCTDDCNDDNDDDEDADEDEDEQERGHARAPAMGGGISGGGGGGAVKPAMVTPPTGDSANKQVAVDNTKHILVEKQMDLVRDFPYWAMNSGLADASKGHGQAGEWRANRGPPYVQATTMFAGTGVDKQGSGNLVRRIVGLKTSFRFHKWEGNNFISNFDGPQFRFLYRNIHSSLIVPPLETSGGCVPPPAFTPRTARKLVPHKLDVFAAYVVCTRAQKASMHARI